MSNRILFATVALALATPAIAADLPSPMPPAAPVAVFAPPPYSWTGFFFGGHLGWDWGDNNFTTTNSATGAFIGSGSNSKTSFGGGGQIGYDYMTSSGLVVGAAAEATWRPSLSTTAVNGLGTSSATYGNTDRVDGNVNARLGYAFGNMLPYMAGGWAWANSTASRTQNAGTVGLATPGTVDQAGFFRNGWDIGAGLEYRVWRNVTVYGQYLYSNYGSTGYTFAAAQRTTNVSSNTNSLEFGVNYRF